MVIENIPLITLLYKFAVVLTILTVFANVCFGYCACKTKVANHYLTIVINQNIGWFDVSMDYIAPMQEVHWTETIVHYDFDMGLLQTTLGACLNQVFKVMVRRLHHNEYVVQLLRDKFVGWRKHINQMGWKALEVRSFVHLAQTLHNSNLSIYFYTIVLMLRKAANQLDCTCLIAHEALRLDHLTEAALPELLRYLVVVLYRSHPFFGQPKLDERLFCLLHVELLILYKVGVFGNIHFRIRSLPGWHVST